MSGFPVDWTDDADALTGNPECRRAGNSVIAAYGSVYEKDSAKHRLIEMERAA
jgi:hypothetical protein